MPRLVLIGTGTGAGKTFVAESLARALARRGHPVQALKPVETGIDEPSGELAPPAGSDAARLEAATLHVAPPRPHPLYRFVPPISPSLAATQAGMTLTTAAIRYWADTALHDTMFGSLWQVLETAGGVFSPLSYDEDNFALARALEPATWVLVAPDSLGVLHDVRATLLAMSARGRAPDHLVLSVARPPDASTGTNAGELARLGVIPPPCCTVRRDAAADIEPLVQALVGAG